VRLVEFLISMLEAHALTLQRLAAFFGEERLLEMLEEAGEAQDTGASETPPPLIEAEWLDQATAFTSHASAYAELESAVHDFKLPAVLEFHLWAYPYYRSFIESPLDLNSRIRSNGGEAGTLLVNDAITQAEAWIKRLPIPPAVSQQAERAAQIPWLRFRTNTLKKIGRRPLGPVY
jgi:hypothetical protein